MLPLIESGVTAVGTFLVDHPEIITAAANALTGGATKAQIIQAIRSIQVEASDDIMREKLGLGA
jgi:benzoyl-CoA reductase/2-hydroxyglutaryl-CoA dehydratase subunit BcrC/BadD/HgdB